MESLSLWTQWKGATAQTGKTHDEESLVSTPTGMKPICEICAGDEVISLDGNDQSTIAKVHEITRASIERIFEVTFANGVIWRTTEDQQIYCGEGEWRNIINAGNHKVATETGTSTKIVRIAATGNHETVYGLSVEGTNILFVNGIAARGFSKE